MSSPTKVGYSWITSGIRAFLSWELQNTKEIEKTGEEIEKLVERGRESETIISAEGETEQFCEAELKKMKHILAS